MFQISLPARIKLEIDEENKDVFTIEEFFEKASQRIRAKEIKKAAISQVGLPYPVIEIEIQNDEEIREENVPV